MKCDQQPGSCGNCQRLSIKCPGYVVHPPEDRQAIVDSALQNVTRQKRGLGSCTKCRSLKIRCSRHKPQCKRCQQRGIDCVYLSKRRHAQATSPVEDSNEQISAPCSPTPPLVENENLDDGDIRAPTGEESMSIEGAGSDSSGSKALPPIAIIRELADVYFSRVHPLRCLGFIHKPTFMRCLDQDCLTTEYSEALILIICAFGMR